jgi:hypothetical protein
VRRTERTGAALALAITLLVVSASCTHVEPWERGRLARPHMAFEPHPLQRALRSHTYSSREAAAGSEAGRGAACGCY